MKRTMKRIAAMLMILLMLSVLLTAAFAEEIGTPTDLAPVQTAEDVQQPTEVIEQPAEVIEQPAETAEQPEEEPQPGSVRIVLKNKDQLYYGDEVTLEAWVSDVQGEYHVEWQIAVPDQGWKTISTGRSFTFVLTEETAAWEYRAAVVMAE